MGVCRFNWDAGYYTLGSGLLHAERTRLGYMVFTHFNHGDITSWLVIRLVWRARCLQLCAFKYSIDIRLHSLACAFLRLVRYGEDDE